MTSVCVCVCGLKCTNRTGRGKLFPELVLTYSFRVSFSLAEGDGKT
jgi:hypothetical protein